jgi:hypothetical protein
MESERGESRRRRVVFQPVGALLGGYLPDERVWLGERKKDQLPKFVSHRNVEAKEFWTEFRRASRKVPERLQEAMVELADTGTCQVDEAQGAELRRIIATLAQPASALITEEPYVRPPVRRW